MREYMVYEVKKWLTKITNKVLEDPLRNLFIFLVSIFIANAMASVLFTAYGIPALIGYVFACLYGATKIIDEPGRAVVWGVGYFFAATATRIFFDDFMPIIKGKDAVSFLAGLVIIYVILTIYLKSRELKHY